MPGKRRNHLLLLLAAALMTYPLLAQPVCDLAVHRDADSCHTRNGATDPAPGAETEDQRSTDDCCTTGCLDCGLPCCTGIATVLTSPPAVNLGDRVQTQFVTQEEIFASTDPDPIDHPPRT